MTITTPIISSPEERYAVWQMLESLPPNYRHLPVGLQAQARMLYNAMVVAAVSEIETMPEQDRPHALRRVAQLPDLHPTVLNRIRLETNAIQNPYARALAIAFTAQHVFSHNGEKRAAWLGEALGLLDPEWDVAKQSNTLWYIGVALEQQSGQELPQTMFYVLLGRMVYLGMTHVVTRANGRPIGDIEPQWYTLHCKLHPVTAEQWPGAREQLMAVGAAFLADAADEC